MLRLNPPSPAFCPSNDRPNAKMAAVQRRDVSSAIDANQYHVEQSRKTEFVEHHVGTRGVLADLGDDSDRCFGGNGGFASQRANQNETVRDGDSVDAGYWIMCLVRQYR